MKNYLRLIAVSILLASQANAQTMQASIGQGSSSSRVIIYIKPSVAVNGNISTLQFDVAIPAGTTPIPTLSIVGTPTIGNGWVIQPSYVEDIYRHYEILTASVFNVNIGVTDNPVMELQFSGGPTTSSNVSLVTLGGGGATTGNALFLCTGVANSNSTAGPSGLYYSRPGVGVTNVDSYNSNPGDLNSISSATFGGVILPVRWLDFNVVKQQNDGLVTWSVENEVDNNYYEVQRSLNGTDFTTIGTVYKNGTGTGTHNYTFTDLNLARNNSTVLYYRLKQVGFDNRTSYSEIRTLRLELTGNIDVYPNPVKKGFYVNIPFVNAGSKPVKLDLISNSGQQVMSREISASQASNYYFDISNATLAAGQYQLRIIYDGRILDTRKLLISQE